MDHRTEAVLRQYKIFVDTSSLMAPNADRFFFRDLAPLLSRESKQIVVAHSAFREINNHMIYSDEQKKEAAFTASFISMEYEKQGLLDVRGERNDPLPDRIYPRVFASLHTRYRLLLITQDRRLAYKVLGLNDLKSAASEKRIRAFRLNSRGSLSEWKFHEGITNRPRFKLCSSPRIDHNKPLYSNPNLPSVGCSVLSTRLGSMVLEEEIAKGGEGIVYRTSTGHACKVYLHHRLTEFRINKLKLMAENYVRIKGVCWPIDTVKNSSNQIVGYAMEMAHGEPIQNFMFIRSVLEKIFPHWTRTNLADLCITIIQKIHQLHNHNVIMGDINLMNILVKDEITVFFVDTDSYQIEDYPCPVGTVHFTAPEIQGKNFSTFLRSFEHEKFAVATLLFMILLLGKTPYSHQGGGDPAEDIKKGEFSYPLGSLSNGKTPYGPWKYIWSHLPFKLKKAFFEAFNSGKRPTLPEWTRMLKSYKYSLENGYLDPSGESNKLFPTAYKTVSTYAKKQYGAEENFRTFICDNCGKRFSVNKEIVKKIYEHKNKYCKECLSDVLAKKAGNQKLHNQNRNNRRYKAIRATKISPRNSIWNSTAKFFKSILGGV